MARNKVLIVEDDEAIRGIVRDFLSEKGYTVNEAGTGKTCRQSFESDRPDVVLMDYYLPDTNARQLLQEVRAFDSSVPVVIISGHGTIELAVDAIKEGAEQFVTKPVALSVLLKIVEKVIESQRYRRKQLAGVSNSLRQRNDPFLGNSAAILRLREMIERIVGTDRPILIRGETGSGKGVLAGWLHQHGPRSDESFVDLNCAGLNRELLESELFGHEKGAFTGAVVAKPGLMEVAHRGTIFLDEIGDMDPTIQPKLLKVLEEKQFRRVGDVRDRSVDVHLIAATHQDLGALVARGKFRSDLYFRVSTIPIEIPPLRERVEDIPIIAQWFIRHLQAELNRGELNITGDALAALASYGWPGNIRELRNVLERAALLCKEGVIDRADLNFQLLSQASALESDLRADLTLQEIERRHIAMVLQQVNGRVEQAALKLGIPRSTLYAKIKEHRIALQSTR